jgi:hypothetical protein
VLQLVLHFHGSFPPIMLDPQHETIDKRAICSIGLEQNAIPTNRLSSDTPTYGLWASSYISLEIVFEPIDRIRSPERSGTVDSPKVLDSLQLKLEYVFHALSVTGGRGVSNRSARPGTPKQLGLSVETRDGSM